MTFIYIRVNTKAPDGGNNKQFFLTLKRGPTRLLVVILQNHHQLLSAWCLVILTNLIF